jgi:NAD(P)-dependent dehydrogenase (short-subunit alcohol dehydrogenase family)
MNDLLAGKLIVVTGGAGLLGREFCEGIASQGGIGILADSNFAAAQKQASQICAKYPECAFAIPMDITNKTSINAAISDLHTKWGKIDGVVNNAYPRNMSYGRRMEEVTYEDFCDNISMHLGGYFLVAQQFSAYFRNQHYGNIVNMSSIYGLVAPRFEIYSETEMTMPVEYAAIKSGVLHLTKYFSRYLKGTNIRVNAISPGGISDGQPEVFMKRYRDLCASKGMLDKIDVVGTLIFLLSNMSAYINGQNLIIDDGFST